MRNTWTVGFITAALMLLVPAIAAAQDGNLVEYGTGVFSGDTLLMNLPRMKVFRDGRDAVV